MHFETRNRRSTNWLASIAQSTWTVMLLFIAFFSTSAADDLTVLDIPDPSARQPSRLYQRLAQEAERAIQRRLAAYERIKTPEDVERWQQQRRAIFLGTLGEFPQRTPLRARTVGELSGDGFRVEKVIFESRPGHHVTALLYLPAGKPPYPGVIVPCGHSFNGKAADGYQRVSMLLAQNGLAALCYDPIGQGERYQTFAEGKPLGADYTGSPSSLKRLAGLPGDPRFNPVEEHTLVGIGSMLVGTNSAQYRIWDGIRAIDYLVERDDIDPKRIGCTGNSGGGTLTAYLMALDKRIVCAAPACYLTTFRKLIATSGPQDAEQNLFGQLSAGLDEADYVLLRAPKPTLLCAGTRDATFDITGTWDIFRQAKRVYSRLGYAERVDLVEADEPHGFTMPLREGAVRWMRRWLLGKDDAITEGELAVRTHDQLLCTPRGQVMLLPGEKSVFDLNRDREAKLAGEREAFWRETPRDKALEEVRRMAGIHRAGDLPIPKIAERGTIDRPRYRIDKLAIVIAPDITLPALAFRPKKPEGEAVLYVNSQGKAAEAAPGGAIERMVDEGTAVLAVDLSGLGELQRRHPRDWGRELFGPNTQEFFLAYILGKSLVGMRTEEILVAAQVARGYAAERQPSKVRLVAVGQSAGIAALHAAAVAPQRFSKVILQEPLRSWSSVLDMPTAGTQLQDVVHGALTRYDLPNLVGMLDAEQVEIIRSSDSAKAPKYKKAASSSALSATDWPWWRGPERNGIAAPDQRPPVRWSKTENVLWSSPVPGRGHGSPTVVGDHVYLATANESREIQSVLCYDRRTGTELWKTDVHRSNLVKKGNKKASQASSTVACDGERLYINFLNKDAVTTSALSREGKLLWQTKVTSYVVHQGYGSSPAVYGPLVIVSADNKGGGAIAGLDRASGKIVWKHDRPKTPNYASPIILKVAGRDQLLFSGCDLVAGYEPISGKKLWEVPGSTTECVTSMVSDGQLVFTSGGYPRNHVAAMRADGSGKLAWDSNTRVYVPSLLVAGGHLYGVTDAGVAFCWQCNSGEELWKGRLGGTFSSSPVLVGEHFYVTNESGQTFIFRATPEKFELIGENHLGDEVFATPTICGSRIYLRVAEHNGDQRQERLYCIGQSK